MKHLHFIRNSFLCLCLILGNSTIALCQVSKSGNPISLESSPNSTFRSKNGSAFKVKLFSPEKKIDNNIESLKATKLKDSLKTGIDPYGVGIDVNIDVKKDSELNILENGGRLWLLEINSSGAFGLQLYFKKFRLPEGAHLFFYSKDKKIKLGAYTSDNNNPNNEFAIQILKGESLILEYYEPNKIDFNGELIINKLIHLFKPVFNGGSDRLGFGTSGLCHINVNCEPLYSEEAKAVTRISVYDPSTNSTGFASGSLINSVSKKPFVLTAYHIYTNTTYPNQYFSNWIFYFNYEFLGCENSTIEPNNYNTVQGVYLRSKGDISDYMLLELPNNPKNYYPVNYLGWDASTAIPGSGALCIHHPNGDVKKIALSYSQPPTTVKTQYVSSTNFVEVSGFPENEFKLYWDEGITYGGSSGSPLIDRQTKRIIGQLHGGSSNCSGADVYWNGPDYFGRLAISWQNPTTGYDQLKNLLAGSGSSITSLNGDYNSAPGSQPYVIIRDITLSQNSFELPKNKLIPQIEVYGNVGTLYYSWTPTQDFSYPNLRDGVITFGNNLPTVFPITKTYTLNVIPQFGIGASKSVSVTLYDCQARSFSKYSHLNTSLQLGRLGSVNETYSWTPTSNLSNPSISNPVFQATTQGTYNYTLTATSAGCTRQEKYSIYAEDGPIPSSLVTSVLSQNTIKSTTDFHNLQHLLKTPDGYLAVRVKSLSSTEAETELFKTNSTFVETSKKRLDRSMINTEVNFIVSTTDGGFVITSKFYHSNSSVAKVIKFDSDLNILWKFEKPETDNYYYDFENLISTSDGGVLVDFHYDGKGSVPGIGNELWKFSASGLLEKMVSNVPSYTASHFTKLCQLSDGGYLVSGDSYELKKYSSDLQLQWVKSLRDGVNDNVIETITPLPDNTAIIGLTIYPPTLYYDPILNTYYLRNTSNFRLLRMDPSGNSLWDKQYWGDLAENLNSVIRLSNGHFLAGGSSNSNSSGFKSENSRGKDDYWIIKLDEHGNYLGDNTYGSSEDDWLYKIFEVGANRYVLAGYSNSPISGDKTVNSSGSHWVIEIEEGICTTPDAAITTSGSTAICNNQTVTLTANGGSNLRYKWYRDDLLVAQTQSITVNTSAPGLYKVIIFKPNSCEKSKSIRVTSLQVTISSSGQFCEGGTVSLTQNTPYFGPFSYSYKWQRYQKVGFSWIWADFSSANTVNVTTAAKYRVIVSAGGCTATSAEFVLALPPTPRPTISYNGDVCISGYQTLTASTGASYLWSNGLTSQSITAYPGVTYTVRVTYLNGCSNTSYSYSVPNCNPDPDPCITARSIEPCLMMLNQDLSTNELSIYPNPVDDKLMINIPQDSESSLTIRIISQLGIENHKSVTQKGTTTAIIDVKNWSSGVYYVTIANGHQLIQRKILVMH